MKTSRLLVVVVVAALAVLVLMWRGEAPARSPAPPAPVAVAPVAPTYLAASSGGSDGTPWGDSLGSDGLRRTLADYQRHAVYPDWSRPLAGHEYLLSWRAPDATELTFDDRPGRELLFRFESDTNFVDVGEAITSWIRVYRPGGASAPVAYQVTRAGVMILSGPRQGHAIALTYRDDGQDGDRVAGDGIFTNRFVPSSHDELAQPGQLQIVADVKVGDVERTLEKPFAATPRPVLEVVGLREQPRGGSLVVSVDVEVFEAGRHDVMANLVGPGDEPIAWATSHHTLTTGRHTVELVFFGKAIRDAGVAGRFRVRDLRGFVAIEDGGFDTTMWWHDERRLETAAYPLTAFSPAEWDAPEKRDRIALYEAAIRDARDAEAGGAVAPPRVTTLHADGTETEDRYPR